MASNVHGNSDREELLQEQARKTTALYKDPHNPLAHLERGRVHERLGFPDLAAADAYRALTLLDSVVDPEGAEYFAQKRMVDESDGNNEDGGDDGKKNQEGTDGEDEGNGEDDEDEGESTPTSLEEYNEYIAPVYQLLVASLVRCGCMRDAHEFCMRALNADLPSPSASQKAEQDDFFRKQLDLIRESASRKRRGGGFAIKQQQTQQRQRQQVHETTGAALNPADLDVQGSARRVLYPWNTHEPDRKSAETLKLLNERLASVAPKCEVRAVALPALHVPAISDSGITTGTGESEEEVSIQLGLFAKADLAVGETILRESSLLTATNRLHDDLCDACNGPLPELSNAHPPVACEGCSDTIFCSEQCHDTAQEVYHGAVCDCEGLDSIGKDIADAQDKADYLYLLLLGRSIAMAATQDVHPLELPEVKYIWGDFYEFERSGSESLSPPSSGEKMAGTLPFSFQLNVLQPMRILDEMGIDPFASLARYDTWVLNTLYAKFRGTASGRLSTWDGGPEVCAVHPLWCLANHSCDPNVRWEWGGEIAFLVRTPEERVSWGQSDGVAGIKKDDEILNHYCDVGLSVQERRSWAKGALGGACQCPRCVWEAQQGQD